MSRVAVASGMGHGTVIPDRLFGRDGILKTPNGKEDAPAKNGGGVDRRGGLEIDFVY